MFLHGSVILSRGGCLTSPPGRPHLVHIISQFIDKTRLHSSRMRTACSLTISPSMLCSGGCLVQGVLAPRGCLAWGCLVPGEVPDPGGFLLPGGVPGPRGGCLVLGECLVLGVVSQHALRQTPPVNRILDTRF